MQSLGEFKPKHFTIEAIESSLEIRSWLEQFPEASRGLATWLLQRLNFISRDIYSAWIRKCVSELDPGKRYAFYAVRKIPEGAPGLWDAEGQLWGRPGSSQGSEDLVYSLIANIARGNKHLYLDHPSLKHLKSQRIHDIVLVDDSIGSGERVSGFICDMQKSRTFLSWWSYGKLQIHILSFARSRESESKIVSKIRGSDHGLRKYRKSTKIHFQSEVVYSREAIESRWGLRAQSLTEMCKNISAIPEERQLGFGNVMSNIVFYHSVPNNLPGVVWFSNEKLGWKALFPGRSLPEWAISLLETRQPHVGKRARRYYDPLIISLLVLIQEGNRRPETIALKLDCDNNVATRLLCVARQLGFLSSRNQLTMAGRNALASANRQVALPSRDRSLYIPTSWSNVHFDVQPRGEKK